MNYFPTFLILVVILLNGCMPAGPVVRIGSKANTESVVLGEIAGHLATDAGAQPRHRRDLGGTRILWNALRAGDIDVYPEYTGTLAQEIFAGQLSGQTADEAALRRLCAEQGIRLGHSLGFNDTYAIGVRKDLVARLKLKTISDLRAHPELKFGFSNEFLQRGDGWPSLQRRYRLPQKDVRGLEHELAYRGLAEGSIDASDLYSTDAEIRQYDLATLDDDLKHFPEYHAVWVWRADLEDRLPAVVAALARLEGRITEPDMVAMNARAKLERVPETTVAADYLEKQLGVQSAAQAHGWSGQLHEVMTATGEHLFLVVLSLGAAICVAVPLGIVAARRPIVGQVVLAVVGLLQTVPTLALLVFVMALLGAIKRLTGWDSLSTIGAVPALIALFLYSLLPIVRNTFTGLRDLPVALRESAEALGLPDFARLRLIEMPLAARAILAGIKIAAVINVGTATLGGFIGAGGYGQLILAGVRQDDLTLILLGAVPAALLALLVQGMFEISERFLVPRGLRLRPSAE